MKTQLIPLHKAVEIHDQGGIVLFMDEEIVRRLHEYRTGKDPMEISCKMEFDGIYTLGTFPRGFMTIVITGD